MRKTNILGRLNTNHLLKDKALSLLIFIAMRGNSEMKTYRYVNKSYQRIYTDKEKYLSLRPNFYTIKYIYSKVIKEYRDVATINLLGFFL